jgi:nucleoside-diphosphate-sugar epimerase
MKVLVAGASGLVGRAAVEAFAVRPGWTAVGVSRRAPALGSRAVSVALDLLDADACRAVVAQHPDVTHLVYAATYEAPGLAGGWFDDDVIERNAAMLRNLFDAVQAGAPELQHVSLLHGTKAYGLHTGVRVTPEMVPLREQLPRVEHRNFYFVQEEYLRARQAERGGTWGLTVFRPTVVYGEATGNNMNPLLPVVAYAALLREQGEPLHRPWPADRAPLLVEAVDAALIGEALVWAATAPTARGETFNLTNGDVFTWEGVWPALADALGMEVGEHRPVSFATDVRPRTAEWAAIVDRHGLAAPRDLDAFVGVNSFVYADIVVPGRGSPSLPALNSTIKVRQAGFPSCLDTEDMFRRSIRSLQQARMIPRKESA